jgi:D-serine deaminase-like pyridoxal phosphate-dependent protein
MNSEITSTALPATDALAALETPAVVVDAAVMRRNIAKAAALGGAAGVAVRPHAKTHKSILLAKLQCEAGAVGITVAKCSEAAVFLEAGFADITVAHALVDSRKIGRLLALAGAREAKLTLIADSVPGLDAIAVAVEAQGVPVAVQVMVDVGLHRCGVDPEGEAAQRLVQAIADRNGLHFAGLISHAGHAYAAADAEAVRGIAEAERTAMLGLAARLDRAGIPVPAISVGSTPTIWLAESLSGITEIRPGNYVFMDLTQVSLGVASRRDVALSVLATVVSCNDRYAIIDAGSKVLSSDRGPHGTARLGGFGLASRLERPEAPEMAVVSLSEEHGFVEHGGQQPRIGERLRIVPNHSCTVVGLARTLTVIDGQSCENWPVDAYGCVL